MTHTNNIRIVLIPTTLDNLTEYSEIKEFQEYNFGSNLSHQLQRTFDDSNKLKAFIINEFVDINFMNTRRMSEIIILTLNNFHEKSLMNDIDFNSYFITYCEVINSNEETEITFNREDFIENRIDLILKE
jgi:hypothetical protein